MGPEGWAVAAQQLLAPLDRSSDDQPGNGDLTHGEDEDLRRMVDLDDFSNKEERTGGERTGGRTDRYISTLGNTAPTERKDGTGLPGGEWGWNNDESGLTFEQVTHFQYRASEFAGAVTQQQS